MKVLLLKDPKTNDLSSDPYVKVFVNLSRSSYRIHASKCIDGMTLQTRVSQFIQSVCLVCSACGIINSVSRGPTTHQHNELSSHGFQTRLIPVLSFKFVSLEILFEKLSQPENYDGLIFTSPRAVDAVKLCLEKPTNKEAWEQCLKGKWNSKRVYVVGKATAALVAEIGLVSEGEESGNAEKLADHICSTGPVHSRPILFPCGSLKREVLPKKLKEKNVPLETLTVYQTAPHPELQASLTDYFTKEGIPENVVFFSPSGVKFCLQFIQELASNHLCRLKFSAIGPTTAEALNAVGVHASCTAETPTPQDLAKGIKSIGEP